MGFSFKKLGRVLKPVGIAAGQAALGAAVSSNPAIAIGVQLVQASLQQGQGVPVDALNALLIPQGYMVIELPKGETK